MQTLRDILVERPGEATHESRSLLLYAGIAVQRRILLAAGGDVTVADEHGYLPIDSAIINRNSNTFKFEDQQIICALLRADKAGATIPPKRELNQWTRYYRYSRAVDWIVRQGGFAAYERSRRLKLMATLDIYLRARQLPDIALSAIVTFSGNPGDYLGDW